LKFINKDLYLGTSSGLVQMIESNTEMNKRHCYYAINPDCMLTYWSNTNYKKYLDDDNSIVYVDGIGVIYAQRLLGLKTARERIATTDLFPELLEYLHLKDSDLNIYLLGGKGNTAERAKDHFVDIFPKVNIVGTHHGFFEDDDKIISEINSLKTDILFVGFGTPVQEEWINKNFHQLKEVKTIVTCGGLFDYYSGNVKRAPSVIRKVGLEWIYRLFQEPKRLYKRYIFGNIKYLQKVLSIKVNNLGK